MIFFANDDDRRKDDEDIQRQSENGFMTEGSYY
jgi:hypothetical protein